MLLTVGESGPHDAPGPAQAGLLRLHFDAQASGCAPLDADTGSQRLPAHWQALGARFAPFDIVGPFVKRLLAQSPTAVRFTGASAVSADLARIASALGFACEAPALLAHPGTGLDAEGLRWLRALQTLLSQPTPPRQAGFGYETYAFGMRDHALLQAMQAGMVPHFEGCQRVLDVGCGTGMFVDLLLRHGLNARGVERNRQSAAYARALGLDVEIEDALAHLETSPQAYDGLYCSHFVEHLPMDAVERLVRLCAGALQPGGVAVFTFPDPESIRSQLLGFWRDPEHVRFYHPEIIEVLALAQGLALEFSSQRQPGRRVVGFSLTPPEAPAVPAPAPGPWQRLLERCGIATQHALQTERRQREQVERWVRQLWDVNQTWAWDDNVVLRFRKT